MLFTKFLDIKTISKILFCIFVARNQNILIYNIIGSMGGGKIDGVAWTSEVGWIKDILNQQK